MKHRMHWEFIISDFRQTIQTELNKVLKYEVWPKKPNDINYLLYQDYFFAKLCDRRKNKEE